MNSDNVINFRCRRENSQIANLPAEFVIRHAGRPVWIVRVYEDGRMWWINGAGGGKAFRDGNEIVIGPYKSYGSAFHADFSADIAADAEAEAADFLARAAALPEAPAAFTIVHWTDVEDRR